VQFETIHPFLDGNGRIGRLLIALVLSDAGVLKEPLLYVSLYFKQHRREYYRLLDQVRTDGEWEAWLDFFLEGVRTTADQAVATARQLVEVFEKDRDRIRKAGRAAGSALRVHDVLRDRPLTSLNVVSQRTGLSFPAATSGMRLLIKLGIAREQTGRKRNRVFAYARYLSILNEGTEPLR
jgi:Fic family protein